jgi:hypothetical protein
VVPRKVNTIQRSPVGDVSSDQCSDIDIASDRTVPFFFAPRFCRPKSHNYRQLMLAVKASQIDVTKSITADQLPSDPRPIASNPPSLVRPPASNRAPLLLSHSPQICHRPTHSRYGSGGGWFFSFDGDGHEVLPA